MQLSLMRLVTPFKTATEKITFIMKIAHNMTPVYFSFYKITLRGIMQFREMPCTCFSSSISVHLLSHWHTTTDNVMCISCL